MCEGVRESITEAVSALRHAYAFVARGLRTRRIASQAPEPAVGGVLDPVGARLAQYFVQKDQFIGLTQRDSRLFFQLPPHPLKLVSDTEPSPPFGVEALWLNIPAHDRGPVIIQALREVANPRSYRRSCDNGDVSSLASGTWTWLSLFRSICY
jgi:hypothetical protein